MNDREPFQPPTAEQVRQYLRRCSPTPPINADTAVLAVCLMTLLLVWEVIPGEALSTLLTWVVIVGYLTWRFHTLRRQQRIQQGVRSVYELALLRRTPDALTRAWTLLPDLTRSPAEHGQVVSIITSCLMRERAHEPTAEACDYLLEHVPPKHPAGHFIRLQRALALLHADRLVDADDELRKLRNADLGQYERAMLTAAMLYQQIKTNHHADAVAIADDAVDRLHPLGVDAGYSYGLIATAFRQRGEEDAARRWWRLATMLIPGSAIVYTLPETHPMLGTPEGAMPMYALSPPPLPMKATPAGDHDHDRDRDRDREAHDG